MADAKPKTFLIRGRVLVSHDVRIQYTEQDIPATERFLELFNELDRCGLIARLKTIPHYGTIKISVRCDHSRYDYVCQQLALHGQARRTMKGKHMAFKYGNKTIAVDDVEFSLYDAVAILALVSNIGHFKVIERHIDIQFHLLNALVLMERCNGALPCVKIAKEPGKLNAL